MTENMGGIELRLSARRIGLLDTGGGHRQTDGPTSLGVLRPFTGVLDAPVHRTTGPPVDLSYLTLAPLVRRALVARGRGGSPDTTADASETVADDQGRDNRAEPGTELMVRDVLRERDSTEANAADGERAGDDGGDGADASTGRDATVRTVTPVDREWTGRTPPGVEPPTVTGSRRTVLNLSRGADAPDAGERPSHTARSGDPDRRQAPPTAEPESGVQSIGRRSVDASDDRDGPAPSDRPTPTGTAPADRDAGGVGTGAVPRKAPDLPTDVGEMAAPRLTLRSSAAAGTLSGQVDEAGPTIPSGRGSGRVPAAAAVGGPDVVGSTQTADGEPSGWTTGPALTVRRTAAVNGTSAGGATHATGGSRAGPTESSGGESSGAARSSELGDRRDNSDALAALLENGDADRFVDKLYQAISRRMAIERDRRGG